MSSPDQPERILGEHYRVVEKIGQGGMGEVYKAVDRRLDRTVALKLLAQDAIGDDERRKRFVKEAQAASALEHPTIVTIHDMVDTGEDFFIVMQYVEGQTLRDVIHLGKVELATAINYGIQLAEGLIRAHGAGVIHRDLKPENLMMTKSGQLKILDFGLAKLIEPDESEEGLTLDRQTLTKEGHILGTVNYMSPEQAHGKKIDPRSDIFSFGSVFYELVTGWKAFEGKSLVSTIASITRDEPKPIRHYIASIPIEVEAFIERALQKDPDDRFQTMEDVRAALETLARKLESGSLTPADRAVEQDGARAKKRRVAAGIVGVVAASVVAATFLSGPAFPSAWTVEPLTELPGIERDPVLSPDGNQIAFSWNGESEGAFGLYIMQVGSTSAKPLRLTNEDADHAAPAWSPDTMRIAFSRREDEGTVVHTVPALGGASRRLANTSEAGVSYNADSTRLAIVKRAENGRHAIFTMSTETGEETQLTDPPEDAADGDTRPLYSRDRAKLAFIRDGDLYVVSASGGDPDRLTEDAGGIDGFAWSPDGRHLVYASGGTLWSIASRGGEPQSLDIEGNALSPTIGPNSAGAEFVGSGPDFRLVFARDGDLFLARPAETP